MTLPASAREDTDRDAADVARRTRVTLVTGGTGGIGTAICQALADLGSRVVSTFHPLERDSVRRWQRERRHEGYAIAVVECDVASFDACARMAREVRTTVGPVDILVNCAGITRDKTLGKMEEHQWHDVLDTNLDSVFNVTRNLIDGMIERRYGRIINISSVNGQKGQFGQTNYSAAKAGMHGFTKALAQEVADAGITVNTVSPGYVDTTLVQTIPVEIRNGIISKIPVGRLAKPHEIARAVAFLAAEESGYITGSNIPVNGGLFMF